MSEKILRCPTDMQVGTIHKTTYHGDIRILSYGGCEDVYVEFLNSGYKSKVRSNALRTGMVRDKSQNIVHQITIAKDMEEGTVHSTKSNGDILIVHYKNSQEVAVKFIDTGYETLTTATIIRGGHISDKLRPSFCGVGFLGEGQYNKTNSKRALDKWKGMMVRCYNLKSLVRAPTYKGCSVCEEWHNFQNFAAWFKDNFKEGMHLDKDILTEGNKIYSPSTCKFVTPQENIENAQAKYYYLRDPFGVLKEIYNMEDYCRDSDYSATCMRKVYNGVLYSYKGWTPITKKYYYENQPTLENKGVINEQRFPKLINK